MDETKIARAAMGRLAKALVFVCGAEDPTTLALQAAAESGSERGHQERARVVSEIETGRATGGVGDARRLIAEEKWCRKRDSNPRPHHYE